MATLTTRIGKIEHAFAEQLAADDAEMGDPALSWASRAAGAPVAAASRPLGRAAAAAPPVARVAPSGANSKKVRISTHQGIRIKREDAEAAVAAVNTAANGGPYVFAGGPFSNQFAITYTGETTAAIAYARQLLASLKGVGGASSEPTPPVAIEGEPAVRLYFNLDRLAKDLASVFSAFSRT